MWTGTKKGVMWRTHALLRISFRPGTGLSYIPDTSTYCCTSSQVSTYVYIYIEPVRQNDIWHFLVYYIRHFVNYLVIVIDLRTRTSKEYPRLIYIRLQAVLIEGFFVKISRFLFLAFFGISIFSIFFPNYWKAKPSKYFALCTISKLWTCFLFFLLFLFFLEKIKRKIWLQSCSMRTGGLTRHWRLVGDFAF